jgi:hypothetical protein
MTKNDLYAVLAVVAITLAVLFIIKVERDVSYRLGLAEGKLNKMEEFKDTFVPNPANVFPDAITDTVGGF